MVKRRRYTMKMQLSLIFAGILGAMLLFVALYINRQMAQIVMDNTERNRGTNFARIEKELTALRSDTNRIVQDIFLNDSVRAFCEKSCGMDGEGIVLRKKIGTYLESFFRSNQGLDSLLIENSEGDIVGVDAGYSYNNSDGQEEGRITPILSGENAGWQLWTLRNFRSLYYPSENDERYGMTFIHTFQEDSRTIKVSVCVKEEYLYQILASFSDGESSDIYLCDYEGNVVSAKQKDQIGQRISWMDQMTEETMSSFADEEFRKQIVYQKYPEKGWMLVEAIPLELYLHEIDVLRNHLLLLILGIVLVAAPLSYLLIRKMTEPLKVLMGAMTYMGKGHLGHRIAQSYRNEFGEIIVCFNGMSADIQKLMERNRKMEEQKTRYAISALRSQINPHFIFNTINTIKWMAVVKKAENIKTALERLCVLLKPLFKEKSTEVPLQEEIEYVRNYIELVNLRFGEQICLEVSLPEEMKETMIPRFILQPVVENCIEHGFDGDYSRARIAIECCLEETFLLKVRDNGIGMGEETVRQLNQSFAREAEIVENGDRIGLVNINMQIKLLYGDAYGLAVSSNAEGTEVILRLPRTADSGKIEDSGNITIFS